MSDLTERQREYREVYLRSEHWRETRAAALERAEHRCQVCNTTKQLDVHHRTYERLGHEGAGDLTVLCRACHDLFHASAPAPAKAQRSDPTSKRQRKLKAKARARAERRGGRKGDLARDLAAMKQRNGARHDFTHGPMVVQRVGQTDRGYVLSVSTDEYEVRVFSAKHGKSLRVWAVPGSEMVETGRPRPMEPWAWQQEQQVVLDENFDGQLEREA